MNRHFALLLFACVSLTVGEDVAAQVETGVNPAFNVQFEAGKRALGEGKYKDAAGAFKKASKLQDNCYACFLGMASAYLKLQETQSALESCDKAISLAKNDAARATAHNLKGTILLSKAQTPKEMGPAEEEYRTAVQLDRATALYHLNLATVLIRESKDEAAKPELEECLAANPAPALAKQAQSMLADPRRGRELFAPDFKVKTITGEDVSLQQLTGKVVVIDFWATWCPPCRESVGELKALTRKYPAEKLVLLSISADDDDRAWRDFVQKKQMDWLQYRDSDKQLRDAFSIQAFPTYLVIDGEGIIRQRITGLNPQETVVHRLRDKLEAMFQAR